MTEQKDCKERIQNIRQASIDWRTASDPERTEPDWREYLKTWPAAGIVTKEGVDCFEEEGALEAFKSMEAVMTDNGGYVEGGCWSDGWVGKWEDLVFEVANDLLEKIKDGSTDAISDYNFILYQFLSRGSKGARVWGEALHATQDKLPEEAQIDKNNCAIVIGIVYQVVPVMGSDFYELPIELMKAIRSNYHDTYSDPDDPAFPFHFK